MPGTILSRVETQEVRCSQNIVFDGMASFADSGESEHRSVAFERVDIPQELVGDRITGVAKFANQRFRLRKELSRKAT